MATFLITYDMTKEGRDYSPLIKKIKQDYSMHTHVLKSTWLVRSDSTVDQIRDNLMRTMDADDKILVAGLDGNCAWSRLNDDGDDWLRLIYSS